MKALKKTTASIDNAIKPLHVIRLIVREAEHGEDIKVLIDDQVCLTDRWYVIESVRMYMDMYCRMENRQENGYERVQYVYTEKEMNIFFERVNWHARLIHTMNPFAEDDLDA